MDTKKKFNPWLVVLGSLGCSGLLITLANTDGLYLAPVMEEFGWTRTAASLYLTIYNWVAAIMQIFVGKIFEKYDMRKIMSIVVLVFGGTYMWSSTFTQLWQWTVFGVIYGVCAGFFMYIPGALIITRWFKKRTGLAMSLSGVVTGIVGLFFSPISQSFIDMGGWAKTRLIMGIVFTVVCFIFTIAFVRNSPEECGTVPYGADSADEKVEENQVALSGMTCKQALKSPALYICILYTFLVCVACCFVQQISSYAGAFPVGAMAGALALSVFSGIGIPRGPIMGWLFDKVGSLSGNIISSAICAIGMILLIIGGGNSSVLLYIGIACFSFMFVPLTTGTALMVNEVFGTREYSAIYSYMTTSLLVAGGLAPLVYAQLYDRTQSYATLPVFVLVISIILTLMVPVIYKVGKTAREKAEKENEQ